MGSNTTNYMGYVRGNPKDYDEWTDVGNHGWDYKDFLPYNLKLENNRNPRVVNLIKICIINYQRLNCIHCIFIVIILIIVRMCFILYTR